jgi:hypothetical protein
MHYTLKILKFLHNQSIFQHVLAVATIIIREDPHHVLYYIKLGAYWVCNIVGTVQL